MNKMKRYLKRIIRNFSNPSQLKATHLFRIMLGLFFFILLSLLLIRTNQNRNKVSKPITLQSYTGRSPFLHKRYVQDQYIPESHYSQLTYSILNLTNSLSMIHHKRDQAIDLIPKVVRKSYVTIELTSRLGNNLFQYASLLGIASLNNKIPVLSKNVSHLKIFSLSHTGNLETGTWPKVLEGRYAAFDPQFQSLPSGNVTISLYLQSWKYFQHIEKRLRKELQFKDKYLHKGVRLFKTHTSQFRNRTVIAIHVRRSDMLLPINVEAGYTIAPLSYIIKAVEYMRNRFGNPVFLIASDDITWCTKYLTSPDMVVMKTDGDPYTDFVALTQCDHMIMTVGTYGWWAAWFINGHTVYYKEYPRRHSYLSRLFVKKDYFMPQWVPIGN